MNIIQIKHYSDDDMEYTKYIYVGQSLLPDFKEGELESDILDILRKHGYKRVKTKKLTFIDDHFCSSLSRELRKDKRLRLSGIVFEK